MAKLSIEEKIRRIESAPKEVQAMVAKAFLREDIDDEDVQYLFNTDTFEEMNEEGSVQENTDVELPEGIGAAGFIMRTTKPYDDKNYMVKGSGGWSTCIKGSPTDAHANVLANCVGYASGRFNEIINLARGTAKCTYTSLNCNAENFVERAQNAGLKTGSTPKRGAIMCWKCGTLKSGDGAGHVAIVERVDSNSQVYTSESGYGSSKPFWNQTRSNKNGRWGLSSGYDFRCFIYLPDDVQKLIDDGPQPAITPTVDRDEFKNQLKTIDVMNVRVNIETTSPSLGKVQVGSLYNYYEEKQGKSSKWYAITPEKDQWIAGVNNNGHKYCEIMPAKTPEPTPEPEPEPVPEWPKYHTVSKTDTLSGIAKKYYGSGNAAHYNFIAKANNISNPNIIHAGQILIIPKYEASIVPLPLPDEKTTELKIGDKVKIVGTGNGSVYGTGDIAYGLGWERKVLKIWDGKAYPYQIGNNGITTGYYKKEALQKK